MAPTYSGCPSLVSVPKGNESREKAGAKLYGMDHGCEVIISPVKSGFPDPPDAETDEGDTIELMDPKHSRGITVKFKSR